MDKRSSSISYLSDYKVLDLSQYIPGPFATRQLADLGADVIKVEPLEGDPMRHFMSDGFSSGINEPLNQNNNSSNYSPIYQHLNRGKRIVKLDLKKEPGKQILRQLIKGADVLLESFRPGVLARLGFDRETLSKLNPTLIHCALSGFGQNGPYKEKAGHDLNYCAISGALSNSGTREKPVVLFPPLADHAGAMQASNSILAALLSRTHTNQGAFIDISLYESALAWQYLSFHDNSENIQTAREALLLNGGAACYNIYQTIDGRFISLAPLEAKFWVNFCKAVAKPEWIDRQSNDLPQTALIQSVSDLFKTETLSHWNIVFENVDCCYEPILLADEVSAHPQVISRGNLKDANPQFAAWIDGQAVVTEENVTIVDNQGNIDWKYN